jgi:hypothetical protein
VTTECHSCQHATHTPLTGRYNVNCIACMARLIVNARPSKAMQERQIAYLQRHHRSRWPELWPQIQNKLKTRNNNAPQTT